MAPRLHRHAHQDGEETVAPPVPVRYLNEIELALLFDALGVNDLAAIEGAEDRTVTLSDRSTVICPAHGHVLKPDACRSCRFLAGEV